MSSPEPAAPHADPPLDPPLDPPAERGTARRAASPWRAVVGFGVVSLLADAVYEGARSVHGPLLAQLGASALVVGLVTGAGEAVALLLRLVSGSLADRTRRYWALTIAGYALTAVCVPLLALAPSLGAAGLAVASVLILAERLGKAVRSPAKSALLAEAAARVGTGRGMGVHKALDQVGAFAGPLLVAGVAAAAAGALAPGLAVLAVPGAAAVALLLVLRARAPREEAPPRETAAADGTAPATAEGPVRLPAAFWRLSAGTALCTAGLVTFGVLGFHLVEADLVAAPAVPLLYAAAMAAAAVAALATGALFDRVGPRVLLVLPPLVALVPPLALSSSLAAAGAGVLLWGAAGGVQDSTVKALVAQVVPRRRRATAYGWFAGVQGAGALAGGAAVGALYGVSLPALVAVVALVQVAALVLLVPVARRAAPA